MTKGLEERGFLLTRTKEDGRKQKVPTKEGEALGIYMEERLGYRGGIRSGALYAESPALYSESSGGLSARRGYGGR